MRPPPPAPTALAAAALIALALALAHPLHPTTWPLLTVAVVTGGCAAVGFINAADPTPDRSPLMGRHHPPSRPGRPLRVATTVLLIGLAAGTWFAVRPGDDGVATASATAAAAGPPTGLERTFLAELAEAGVDLAPWEQPAAVGVAREHVAHGHLVGMREIIRGDLREAFPRLSDAEVETAKVAVEHHFLAVTGRKQ